LPATRAELDAAAAGAAAEDAAAEEAVAAEGGTAGVVGTVAVLGRCVDGAALGLATGEGFAG